AQHAENISVPNVSLAKDKENLPHIREVFPSAFETGRHDEAVARCEGSGDPSGIRQPHPALKDMAQFVIVAIDALKMRLGLPDTRKRTLVSSFEMPPAAGPV